MQIKEIYNNIYNNIYNKNNIFKKQRYGKCFIKLLKVLYIKKIMLALRTLH